MRQALGNVFERGVVNAALAGGDTAMFQNTVDGGAHRIHEIAFVLCEMARERANIDTAVLSFVPHAQ